MPFKPLQRLSTVFVLVALLFSQGGYSALALTTTSANNADFSGQNVTLVKAADETFPGYKDLSSTDRDYEVFKYLYGKGIITGNPDNTLHPDENVQRDQITKIVLKTWKPAYQEQVDFCNKIATFPDVTLKNWAANYICYAAKQKIVSGYQAGVDRGYFRPARPVSWAEFSVLVTRNIQDTLPDKSSTSYPGVPSNTWFSASAKYFQQHYLSNIFPANTPITRRQVAEIIYKLYQQQTCQQTNDLCQKLAPYANLVPASLKAYDLGQNADDFFVYKKDSNLQNFFKQKKNSEQLNQVEAALGYFSSAAQSGAVIIQFSSPEVATSAVTFFQSLKAKSTAVNSQGFNVQQQNTIVILSLGKGLAAFNGLLSQNPALKNVEPAKLESQFMVFMNHDKSPESTLILFALTNTLASSLALDFSPATPAPQSPSSGLINANDNPQPISGATGGQGSASMQALTVFNTVLSFAKNSSILLNYRDQSLHIQITTNLLSKEELPTSGALKLLQQIDKTLDPQQLQGGYDQIINQMQKNVPSLQDAFTQSLKSSQNSSASISFDQKTLQLDFNIGLADLLSEVQKTQTVFLNAPARARDAVRKADLNNLVAAIEVYQVDNGKYPEASGCLEKHLELNVYFDKNQPPQDPNGSQNFKVATCTSGYYYQYIPGKQYVLWAKMETLSEGNTNLTPNLYKINAVAQSSGQYFFVRQSISP